MDTSAEDVLESILAKRIDKQDALRSFNKLSEADRNRIVAGLKSVLKGADDAPAEAVAHRPAAPTLKSIHESDLTEAQKDYLRQLAKAFAGRVPKSRHNAMVHQAYFVDQRKVAGLKRPLKPMQFQLTYERAEGAYLYDVDGNKYVDITGDNGVNFFGHQPEFMKKALVKRLNQGYPLVAYSEDLFEAARLFCEITGHERMVFAQSGTEAVMWATRMARAATGKKKVVIFDGSYHGLSDNVLALKGRNGMSMSAGLGLLQEFADQLIVLDYGKMEELDTIEKHADDIACVLTEPIQSRFPSRQPVEFMHALRKLTLEKNIVLIFDEMITGFRAGRKGAEGFYQVKPDLATYGKVPGGGMPTGIIAGLAKYMDYVDGGVWEFDDTSMPSLKRAVMAGTHTQNSLKVSATLAACTEMKRLCQAQDCGYLSCTCAIGELNRKTKAMCDELNAYFAQKRVPLAIEYFSSLFRFLVTDDAYGLVRELLVILLRMNGVETSTSGGCFMNLAHGDADVRAVVDGFKSSVETLLERGFFGEAPVEAGTTPAAAPGKEPPLASQTPPPPLLDGAISHLDKLRALLLADLRSINSGAN
jgi:glutamate-1-semialdehyde aminotransferase